MTPYFESYYERLDALHVDMVGIVRGLSPRALDWKAGPEMNSLTVLVVHVTGAERYWINDVAGQSRSERVRSQEFEAANWTDEELESRLAHVLESSRQTLAGLTVDALAEERLSWRDGKSYTVAWALNHALEHTAIHLGHMQIGKQLWRQSTR